MAERPACTQCGACRMKIDKGAKGWEAYCTAVSGRGRLIAWQYGSNLGWTKRELIDKMDAKICPRWCPMMKKEEEKNDTI